MLLLLSACASAPSLPQSVSVPVPVSCLPHEVPAVPALRPDSDLRTLDDRELVLTIASERLDLLSYARQAEVVIAGCR